MTIGLVSILAIIAGGTLAIWVLQGIINFAVTSRVMDNPVNGKMLATILAYFLGSLLYLWGAGTFFGFAYYIPGAIIVGFLELRSARKVQARIDAQDESSTFE